MVASGKKRARLVALGIVVVLVAVACGPVRYRDQNVFSNYTVCSDVDYKAEVPACGQYPVVHGDAINQLMQSTDAAVDAGTKTLAQATTDVQAYANLSGADVYQPANDTSFSRAAVIQIHGGALLLGAKTGTTTGDNLTAQDLVKRGYVVVTIDYHLEELATRYQLVDYVRTYAPAVCADSPTVGGCWGKVFGALGQNCDFGTPTNPPATVDTDWCRATLAMMNTFADGYRKATTDILTAVRWTRRNAGTMGADPNKVYLLGESTGGVLAAFADYGLPGEAPALHAGFSEVPNAAVAYGQVQLDESFAHTDLGTVINNPAYPAYHMTNPPTPYFQPWTGALAASDPPMLSLEYEIDNTDIQLGNIVKSLAIAHTAAAPLRVEHVCGAGHLPAASGPSSTAIRNRSATWLADRVDGKALDPGTQYGPLTMNPVSGVWVDRGHNPGQIELSGVSGTANDRTAIAGDFNGDHIGDLFWWGAGTACDSEWFGQANGVFAPQVPVAISCWPPDNPPPNCTPEELGDPRFVNNLAAGTRPLVADFNGDGFDDIFFVGNASSPSALWYGSATGLNAASTATVAVTATYDTLVVGDFDHDGFKDILGAVKASGASTVWRGQATGGLSPVTGPTLTAGFDGAVAGDFDGDSFSDVLLYAGAAGAPEQLLRGGTSGGLLTFTPVTFSLPDGAYAAVVAGDFDNDGRADVLAYGHAGNNADVVAFGQASPTTPLVAYDSSVAGNGALALPDGAPALKAGPFDPNGGDDVLLLFDAAGTKRMAAGAHQGATPGWNAVTGWIPGTGTYAPVTGVFDGDGDGQHDLVWLR